MIPHAGHYVRMALVTLFSCIAAYATFTGGLEGWTTWAYLSVATLSGFYVTIETVRIWQRKEITQVAGPNETPPANTLGSSEVAEPTSGTLVVAMSVATRALRS